MSATADASGSLSHLQAANVIRRRRKDEHALVRALPRLVGREALAEFLDDPPAWLGTAPIGEVLCWPSRTYTAELDAWLDAAGASPLARVCGAYARDNSNQNPAVLSHRQRLILAACLRGADPLSLT